MKCAFCQKELPKEVKAVIRIIDGECPSSCDDVFTIRIKCPYCKKIAFAKTVIQGYIFEREWPDFVEIDENWQKSNAIIRQADEQDQLDDDDEFTIYHKDNKVFLTRLNKQTWEREIIAEITNKYKIK